MTSNFLLFYILMSKYLKKKKTHQEVKTGKLYRNIYRRADFIFDKFNHI